MATFALIHGGGGSAWDWHLVAGLRERGHDAVEPSNFKRSLEQNAALTLDID